MTDSLREDLHIHLGQAYNNQKTMNQFGSANGLIDEMIRITFRLIEKRIDSMIVEDVTHLPKALRDHHNGFTMGLKKVKEILK